MKLAAPYTNDARWRDIPDEYNINYTKTSTYQKLYNFCSKYSDKRINICFTESPIAVEELIELSKHFSNFYIRALSSQLVEIIALKKHNIKFFLDSSMPCYSASILDFALKTGTTDIYIYDELWYALPQVYERCEKAGVQIRLILNRIPSLRPDVGNDYCAPIFSPRDKEYLDQYIAVGEFDCTFEEKNNVFNWHKFNVYYKAWFIKKEWLGLLDEINIDLHLNIPVTSLPPNFVYRRGTCKRRCSFDESCKHCPNYIKLAKKLYNNNIYFKQRAKN